MPTIQINKEDNWIKLDDKSSNPLDPWNEDIHNYSSLELALIPITNTLDIEKHDLKNDFIIHHEINLVKNHNQKMRIVSQPLFIQRWWKSLITTIFLEN